MQEIIVYIIGLLAAAYIAVSIYRMTVRRGDPCRGCEGCELKSALEEKQKRCTKAKKSGPSKGSPSCH